MCRAHIPRSHGSSGLTRSLPRRACFTRRSASSHRPDTAIPLLAAPTLRSAPHSPQDGAERSPLAVLEESRFQPFQLKFYCAAQGAHGRPKPRSSMLSGQSQPHQIARCACARAPANPLNSALDKQSPRYLCRTFGRTSGDPQSPQQPHSSAATSSIPVHLDPLRAMTPRSSFRSIAFSSLRRHTS